MTCPPHPTEALELVRKNGLGGSAAVRQCGACGQQIGGAVPLSKLRLDGVVISRLPLFDQRKAHRPQPTRRRREYLARFRKADWKKKRQACLERAGFECQMAGCGQPATEAHHFTYERFGHELPDDLLAVCSDCNRAEREQRVTAYVLGDV